MRLFIALLSVAWSFAAYAQPTAEAAAAADPVAVKVQLENYYFDAARRGDVEMLDTFIAAGYSLDTQDEKGYTALILAAYHGQGPRWSACWPLGPTPAPRTSVATRP